MQAIVVQTLRACGRSLPAKSWASRVALSAPRRSFLIAPSYKSRVAVAYRNYATAAATKKTTAKKPAATKKAASTTGKKTTTRKKAVATKTKTKAKSKSKVKAAKKPAKAKPKKKELTPEKKAALLKRKLKENSLYKEQPTKLPFTKWLVYSSAETRVRSAGGKELGATMKSISEDFKKLSVAEIDRLSQQAEKNSIQNEVEFKKWVESYPVEVIAQANRARASLHRRFQIRHSPKKIVDERKPKRPAPAFALYISAHAHEFPGHDSVTTRLKAMAEKWNKMSESEKKAFSDLSIAERTKYQQEKEHIAGKA